MQQKTGNDIIRTVNRRFERIVHMDKVWIIIVLVFLIYFATVILISIIRTLMTKRNRKSFAKETFKETFGDFFFELLNPFNWL